MIATPRLPVTFRLGVKLALRREAGAAAHRIALTVACAVSFITLWVMLGAHLVTSEQDARVAGREPVLSDSSASAADAFWLSRFDFVGDKQIVVVYLHPGSSSLRPPPGLPRWPAPGEAFLSPALLQQLDEDGHADTYGDVVGAIHVSGLSDPNEMFAYIGPSDPGMFERFDGPTRITGFGRVPTDEYPAYTADPAGRSVGELYWLVGVVLVIPTLLLLFIAVRSNAELRDRRLAMLEALGAPTGSRMTLVAGEAAPAVILGTLLGSLLVAAAMWRGLYLPLIGYSVRGSDLATGAAMLPIAALLFIAAVIATCCAAQVRSRRIAATRPGIIQSRLRAWPGVVFLVALTILIWISTTSYQGGGVPFFSRRAQGFLLTLLVVLAVLPAAAATVASPIGKAIGNLGARRGWPTALIGGRWIAERPTALARLSAAIVVGQALLVLSQALVSQVGSAGALDISTANSIITVRSSAATVQEADRFRVAVGVNRSLAVYRGPQQEPVVVANCQALSRLGSLNACDNGSPRDVGITRKNDFGVAILNRSASILVGPGSRLTTRPPDGATMAGFVILNGDGPSGIQPIKADAFENLPFPDLSTGGQHGRGGDFELARVYTWLWSCLLPGALILMLASLLSAIDTFLLQARTLGFVGSLTSKPSVYLAIAAWSIFLPLIAAALGGAGISTILGTLFVKLRATGQVDAPQIAYGVLSIVIFAAILTAICATIALRRSRRWIPSPD